MQVATAQGQFAGTGFDVGALIDRAAQDACSGRLADAEAVYARIVLERPDCPDAWFLYGLTAFAAGRHEIAIERLQKAITMRRASPRYRLVLARAYLGVGRVEYAVAMLETARRLAPDDVDVAVALSRVYLASGDAKKAASCSKQAIGNAVRQAARTCRHILSRTTIPARSVLAAPSRRAVPWPASQCFERGRLAERLRDVDLAVQHYRQAAVLAPDWAAPLAQLGRIAYNADQFASSRSYLETAAECAPEDAEILAAYGRSLSRFGLHDQAQEAFSTAVRLAPASSSVRCQYGWACIGRHDMDAAFEQLGAALAMLPNHAEACAGMASCYTNIGDTASACQWLDRTLQTDPAYADAYRDLANLNCLTPDDHRFAQLVRLATAPGQTSRRRSILNKALGEAYRIEGDTEKAFAHYDLGNALKDVTFDIETHRRYLDRVMRNFVPPHFERVAGKGVASEVPVFIVGMARSGTSLIEQIMASHPDVYGAGERADIFLLAENLPEVIGADAPFPECVAQLQSDDVGVLAAEQFDRLRSNAPDKARITDKMPGNFLYLGLIATLFPNARIIHCRRDPLDVCLSIYFGEFGGHHPYAYDLEHLGLFYREYERIMEYWSHALPLRIFDVRYEDVVDDVEGMTRRLIEFCGLPWDDRCLEFHKNERAVHTRSRLQVRQPIYRSSCGRWRPYARYLAPLADALGGEHPARLRAEINA